MCYPLYLDEPSIEDQCGVRGDDLTDTSLPVAKVRGDGDPTSLPQAHVHEPSVHASNDTTVAQRNNVRGVVVKAAGGLT
jgi:hypothetical protein